MMHSTSSPDRFQIRLRSSETSQASGTLASDERFQALPNKGGLLGLTSQARGLPKELFVNIQSSSHVHCYAHNMHIVPRGTQFRQRTTSKHAKGSPDLRQASFDLGSTYGSIIEP